MSDIRDEYLERVMEVMDLESLEMIARDSVQAAIRDMSDVDLENLICELGWEDLLDVSAS